MANRQDLAEKLEVIGSVFLIDGMDELIDMIGPGASNIKINSIIVRIEAKLMKADKTLADKLISICRGISIEEVEQMDDADYSVAMKQVIEKDVFGFFASSRTLAGKK